MRSKTIFGALLVSVALCSQGFGLELLDRMLGLNGGGCGECKVACCDPCAKACCPEPCAKACPEPCAQANCGTCCKKCRPTPVRDLFANIADMFTAKGVQCETVACAAPTACCPEPACCEKPAKCRKVRCCKKACCCDPCAKACCDPCEKVACQPACEPACQPKVKCHKLYRRPVLELLEAMFGCKDCCNPCGTACCDTGCGCGGGAPAAAPAAAPAKAPEQAAPLPQAPKADPSAAIPSRGIYSASRSLVRN